LFMELDLALLAPGDIFRLAFFFLVSAGNVDLFPCAQLCYAASGAEDVACFCRVSL
jgi:hypothetical protein